MCAAFTSLSIPEVLAVKIMKFPFLLFIKTHSRSRSWSSPSFSSLRLSFSPRSSFLASIAGHSTSHHFSRRGWASLLRYWRGTYRSMLGPCRVMPLQSQWAWPFCCRWGARQGCQRRFQIKDIVNCLRELNACQPPLLMLFELGVAMWW
jgi:hypothetical protein